MTQTIESQISVDELTILGHSLGINVYHAMRTKIKKDRELPVEFYRNYFCASVNHDAFPILDGLMRKGLMESWTKFDNLYFGVTDSGIEIFRNEFEEQMKNTKR